MSIKGELNKVKNKNESITFLIFLLFLTVFSGCEVNTSLTPVLSPNPTNSPENNTVSYVKVVPSSSNTKVNQSIQLTVKGYNTEDEWVVLDKSNLKLWKWTVQGQCYNCIEGEVSLNPKSNSLITTFSSGVAGTFFIGAYYRENISDDYITDYVEIKVTK